MSKIGVAQDGKLWAEGVFRLLKSTVILNLRDDPKVWAAFKQQRTFAVHEDLPKFPLQGPVFAYELHL